MMTWALSLVAIIAMSDRTLLTSHARCWIVGSLPYLLCHLTTCASASFYGAVERSARAWSPALQAGPVLIRQFHPSARPRF